MPASRPTIPEDTTKAQRRQGVAYTVTTVALSALMALVVLDGASVVDAFGVDTSTTTATADGYTLSVRAATVSRPALATPFEITVTRADGFDEPVEVAVETSYLSLFDYQRMYPEPAGERTHGPLTVLEFDPPDGEELVVSFDWRMEPAAQSGGTGRVAVMEGDEIAVEVTTELWVWP